MFTHDDTLDLTGDWKFTVGHAVGLTTDGTPAGHFVPIEPGPTFEVRFEPDGTSAHGLRYKGHYKAENPPHHPDLEREDALRAETFYAKRGVFVVQLVEHVEQYFAVFSGHHQHYATADPARVEIVGGWADVGDAGPDLNTNSHKGNFTLVKIS